MNETTKVKPNSDEQRGITCRRCEGSHFQVIYTRKVRGGRIMRRRECRYCGQRVTTWESIRYDN